MIKIIKVEEQHIPDIRKLWLEFIEYSAEIDPIFTVKEGADADFEKKFLRPHLKHKNSLVLVAVDGKQSVAYAVAGIQKNLKVVKHKIKTAGIEHVFITKSRRHDGIGGKLYAAIIEWFHLNGVNRVELHVMAYNKAALDFWRKQGFKDFQHTWYREI